MNQLRSPKRTLVLSLLLLSCIAASWPAFGIRKVIKRRFPIGGDFRPATPFGAGGTPTLDLLTFTAPTDGTASVTIGTDAPLAASFGIRIDNVAVLELSQFLGSTCGVGGSSPCWVLDTGGCYLGNDGQDVGYDSVWSLVFDTGAPPPPPTVALFETFEAGIPGTWSLDGACWDGASTAPTSVTGLPVCRVDSFSGGSIALNAAALGCATAGPEASFTIPVTGLVPGAQYVVLLWWGSVDDDMVGKDEDFFVDLPGSSLLLVDDDDDDPDVRGSYTTALDALGVGYDVWTTAGDADEPMAADLAAYETVVWFSGDAYNSPADPVAGPGARSASSISAFLDGGGCFLLSSQDYLFDHGESRFSSRRLGVGSAAQDVAMTTVTGVGPFAGIGPSGLTFPGESFPDAVTPNAGSVLAFSGDAGEAAVAAAGAASHAAFLGFPLEALPAADREATLTDLSTWCASPTILLVDDDDDAPDVRTAYTDALDALGFAYDLWVTNGDANEPTAGDLAPYRSVIWFSGDAFGDPDPVAGPGGAAEAALTTFLGNGGCLLLSSQDYLFDHGITPFGADTLGVASVTNDVGFDTVIGLGPFRTVGSAALTFPGQNYTDEVVPTAGAELAFSGAVAARGAGSALPGIALLSTGGAGPTSLWTFGLETLPAPEREAALGAWAAWCGGDQIFSDGFESGSTVRW